jgi:hypothetical protein
MTDTDKSLKLHSHKFLPHNRLLNIVHTCGPQNSSWWMVCRVQANHPQPNLSPCNYINTICRHVGSMRMRTRIRFTSGRPAIRQILPAETYIPGDRLLALLANLMRLPFWKAAFFSVRPGRCWQNMTTSTTRGCSIIMMTSRRR